MDIQEKQAHLSALKAKFDSYSPITSESWACIQEAVRFQLVKKGEVLLRASQISRRLFFICKGALRAFCTDVAGNSYNKNLFLENDFAGSTVSAILKTPSTFTLECLEDSVLISIDYSSYRNLIFSRGDLKDFYIAYLERNWVIEKEQREVSIVQENATLRYLRFLQQHPDADRRIALQHIASHLGITPTQLSRIRKNIKK
ncbi:Crp/Fnr family transcriptional regulator [Pedobacter yulinensis]|uniref:Crp/Fnr family transcriptional regulator n=2 Tax=Pedobacter yulinensis TaxID=2126353 RepID=A0A2T3HN21_9SPHI|nr:Crp/Fnr family transcriptional regulator [Pedobacter yulinensis]